MAGVVVVFGFLPIVNWVPGGRAAGWFGVVARGWGTGTALVAGFGVLGWFIGRRWTPRLGWWAQMVAAAEARPARTAWILGASSALFYCIVARAVFDGMPLHLDEIAQVIQARIFAQGRLYLDAPALPVLQSALHVLDGNGRWFTQFPPGGPLLLVPGVWLGATFTVGPVLGGVSVALFWALLRRSSVDAALSLGSVLVLALSPFMVFLAASHMNHVATLCGALLAWWAALHHASDRTTGAAIVMGAALGMMATIRPVDALAVALPLGAWSAWRLVQRSLSWRHAFAMLAGLAVPVSMLLWYNWRTTGNALLFAYEQLWGAEHGLGFHASPWGQPHTPTLGLELVSLYFLRLQTYLFETPVPSLVFVAIGLALAWNGRLIERLWAVTGFLLIALYGTYWHDGFYLGPRFVFLLVAPSAFYAVSGVAASWRRWEGGRGFLTGGLVASLGFAVLGVATDRGRQYAAGLTPLRWNVTDIARRAGVENAVVLVRETWGAQLMARLWAVGVSRSASEWIYRTVDACALEEALTQIEGSGGARDPLALLRRLTSDSGKLVPSPWSPDQSERALPGRPYSEVCQRRIREDRAGTHIYMGVLASEWGSNTYLKDLHGLNARHPAMQDRRRWYVLRGDESRPGAEPILIPIDPDSARADWALR